MSNLMEVYVATYKENKLIHMPLRGKVPVYNGWTAFTKSPIFKNLRLNIGIITGKISGVSVVDIDTKDDGKLTYEAIKMLIGDDKPVVVRTGSGGLHLYYKYDAELRTAAKCISIKANNVIKKVGIDIRNDGGQVVAPPSIHPTTKRRYEFDELIDGKIEFSPINPVFKSLLVGKSRLSLLSNGTYKIEDNKRADNILNTNDNRPKSDFKYEGEHQIREIVMNIKKERADDRDTWIRVCFIISAIAHENKVDLSHIAIEFSKRSGKYGTDADVLEKYNNGKGQSLTIATLFHYLKEDNPEVFTRVTTEKNLKKLVNRDDIRDLIADVRESQSAKELKEKPKEEEKKAKKEPKKREHQIEGFSDYEEDDDDVCVVDIKPKKEPKKEEKKAKKGSVYDIDSEIDEDDCVLEDSKSKKEEKKTKKKTKKKTEKESKKDDDKGNEQFKWKLVLNGENPIKKDMFCTTYDIAKIVSAFYNVINVSGDVYIWNKEKKQWGIDLAYLNEILAIDMSKLVLNNYLCAGDGEIPRNNRSLYLNLAGRATRQRIIGDIEEMTLVKDDPFDKNPFLVGFKNGVYDLEKCVFRHMEKEDMITKIIPHDYVDVDEKSEEMVELDSWLSTIFPIEEERFFFLKCLSTALYGETVQNIFIVPGVGGNGKDCLINFLKVALGSDYFYLGNGNTLSENHKGGPAPELANMDKKRCVMFNEQAKDKDMKCAILKNLTGSETINARNLYSSNTIVNLTLSLFLNVNAIPRIDLVDDALYRRLVIIPFRGIFRTEEKIKEYPENTPYLAIANPYFNTLTFRKKCASALISKLIKHFKQFQVDNYIIKGIPETVKNLSKQYLTDNDEFTLWFREHYKKVEIEDEKGAMPTHLSMKDVFTKFKTSDIYENFSKKEKRLNTYKKICDDTKSNVSLRCSYVEVYKKRIDGKQQCLRNILLGWAEKEKNAINNEDSDSE